MRLNCVLVLLGAFLALSVGERAESHDNWERIVKRTAETWRDENYEDDAAHIVNVQDYYRHVFQEGWDQPVTIQENSAREQLIDLLHMLQEADAQGKVLTDTEKALIREEAVTLASQGGSTNIGNLHKKVRGRYIVMFQESADDYVLDRTIEILQQAHQASDQRVRVTDVSPFSHIGKGFTATLNSKAVELVRYAVNSHTQYSNTITAQHCLLCRRDKKSKSTDRGKLLFGTIWHWVHAWKRKFICGPVTV